MADRVYPEPMADIATRKAAKCEEAAQALATQVAKDAGITKAPPQVEIPTHRSTPEQPRRVVNPYPNGIT